MLAHDILRMANGFLRVLIPNCLLHGRDIQIRILVAVYWISQAVFSHGRYLWGPDKNFSTILAGGVLTGSYLTVLIGIQIEFVREQLTFTGEDSPYALT